MVEEYFGKERRFGRRNDNLSFLQFGYNVNTIRMQRCIVTPTDNARGAHKRKRKPS